MIERRALAARPNFASRGVAFGLLLCASTLALGVAHPARAQDSGVAALLDQAKYWRAKGREDLAQQALRRALALDPDNPAIAAAARAPKATPKPAATKSPVPKPPATKSIAKSPATNAGPQRAATAAVPPPSAGNRAETRAGQARVAGFEALDANELEDAASQFEKALATNPRDGDALGGLGIVRLRQNNFGQAADLLERASRYGKASQWAKGLASARYFAGIEEARARLANGDTAGAQVRAEELVRSNYPDPSGALEILAQVYEKQGRYADAADLYRQASEGSGADEKRLQMRAARGRALAAAERGDELGAIKEFQSGLLADPTDPWIRYEFAQYMIKRGRVPEAESLLRSLVGNGGADSLYAAALINQDLGRSAEAERLIGLIPETQRTAPMRAFAVSVKTDSAIARARALAANGQREQALGQLRQLAGMSGMPVAKQAAIASALFDLGDPVGAGQLAEAALNGQISSLDDYEGLIGVLVQTGRDDLAQLALERAAALAGSSPQGQLAYARMQATMMVSQADRARLEGRFADSFDILQSAYAAAPDNPEILAGLARLYQGGNMAPRAAQTWQLYLSRKPGDKDGLIGLAQSAQSSGDGGLADEASTQLLRAFPEDYQVYMALAGVERSAGNDRKAARYLKEARALYARQTRSTDVAALGGNPFAGMPGNGAANPFRNLSSPAAAAPQPVNPFALGNGTRLPDASYAAMQSRAAPAYMPDGYAASARASTSAPAAFVGTGNGTSTQRLGGYTASPAGFAPSDPTGTAYSMRNAASAPVGQASPGPGGPIYGADPVMAQIEAELVALQQDTRPRVEVDSGYRQRSGETGLSQLDEITGSAKVSTGLGPGRVYARAQASVIDAGRLTGSGLARFGRNATPEAQGIVDQEESDLSNADSQHASGVAFAAGYQSDAIQAEAGTTPVGMGKTKFAFRAAATPRLSQYLRASAFAERKPVTDSVVSYAGTRDPVTGERWGQVMRFGAGAGLSYDADGNGVYGEGRYYRFDGQNVVRNTGFEANVGGYLRAWRGRNSSLTVGLNVNYQGYDKSQNTFTFGNGGYFSPQSFLSVGFPINYAMEDERFVGRASFTPGFQSYSEDQSLIYPTDPVAQAELDALKDQNSDVRSYYDGISKTGFALSAQGELYYKLSPLTRIGGEASYNTFGSYDEFRGLLGVRQSIGSTK
ncbi:MAG: cellulose synthase subunit BcsC-related outer membrane protein [Novosphingobium sp.]|nr:cellulose synthase subunit BcsC-related outer membrane protein [Novosphingobium sp.]